uniref:Cytochrome c biogenesis protein ResB n=1 Tax=Thermodesulfobacterium geofontis TaxID=1295609 RepID=A0A7V5XHF4_9BACT
MSKLWDFLSSARLAITLFLILAFISIFGTIIPQGEPSQFYFMKYGSFWGKIILLLKLDDAYHSWWYIGTLFLFLVNLIACSIKRFPISWKLYKKDPLEINPENLPYKYQITLKGKPSEIENFICNKLKFKRAEKDFNGKILFYRDLNRWAHLSVYLIHFSVIIIIIGALIGAIGGYRGNMWIVEGQTSNTVLPFKSKEPIFLNFFVKLNKFTIEFYPDGTPKEYISNVTVVDGNQTIDALIKVNSPFKYKGLSFYQANYDNIPEFKIKVRFKGGEKFYTLNSLSPVSIDDRYTIALDDFGEAHGLIYAKIIFFDSETGQQIPGIIIKGFPHFNIPIDKDRLQIFLEDIEKVTYVSGLQVKKDPGIPVVYVGFILIIIGLSGVYFFEPKTFWIFLIPEKDKVALNMGAYAKRERDTLKLKLEEIGNQIKDFTNQ